MEPTKTNGIPLWYKQVLNHLATAQSEVFALHGDVLGYPVYPGETLPMFLRRMTLAPARKRVEDGGETDPERMSQLVAEQHVFVTLSPATGLVMDAADKAVFDKFSPPPDSNPFAAPGGGGLTEAFSRLQTYFANTDAAPLALVIQDADLLWDAEAPMVEPERTLLSYLRRWSERPLVTSDGRPHRVFLIARSQAGIRPALLEGRVAQVKLPLPTEEQRRAFIDRLVTNRTAEVGAPTWEEGMDATMLARITGALNLLQVEDVFYQAEQDGGRITRKLVQTRKDELVKAVYGGVLEISYPTQGFDSLVGYEEIKRYFQEFTYPLLLAGDPGCPKGCVLSGPPGTGKSVMPSALSAELQLPLVVVRMDLIKDMYVGQSGKKMAKFCEGIIALAPCIVLFDEIDKVLPSDVGDSGVSQELIGQLQTFLSEIPRGRAYFVATTNFPSRIPRAMLRPGRFEEVVPMLPQHLDGIRGQALKVVAGRANRQFVDVDFQAIGEKATDYTGADLEKLAITSHKLCVMDGRKVIEQRDLEAALANIVPTLRTTQSMVDEALEFCSDRSYVPASLKQKVGVTVAKETATTRRLRQIE